MPIACSIPRVWRMRCMYWQELMRQIAAIVKESAWTQMAAAEHCGLTQPRTNDFLRGRVSRFSLDALLNIATAIGRRVHVALEVA